MTTFLPQLDPAPVERAQLLASRQRHYRYNYNHVSPLAILDLVPIEDEFSFTWLKLVAERVVTGLSNRAESEAHTGLAELHRGHANVLEEFSSLAGHVVSDIKGMVYESLKFDLQFGAPPRHAQSLKEYSEMFRSIGLPPIAADFMQDEAFAWLRVAGPNPVMLQRLKAHDERFPMTNALFQSARPDDSYDAALDEGRLFFVDYALLDGAELGSFPHGQKYLCAPLALFVVEKNSRRLLPVAIQCQQKPGPNNPIFTPADGWNWMIAKTMVEIADGNLHEASTHLGRTHLLMEPFAVSTIRHLAPTHPISILLLPHFEGTLAINAAAWQHLIADQGAVDKLFGGSIKTSRGVAVWGVQSTDVMRDLLPNTFCARGVDNHEALPNYPYRDDAMLYWDAIHQWVRGYVGLYYPKDQTIVEDFELQAWLREVAARDGGRINGLPQQGALTRADELVEVLTFILYTCSVQHAAVNFPQYDVMSYAPCMPLAAYRPPPTKKTGATEADFIATLPTLDMAELQMELGYMLGTVHYTRLGQYRLDQFCGDKRVLEPLSEFQQRLERIRNTIEERNRQRRPYRTLTPDGIPQSINI